MDIPRTNVVRRRWIVRGVLLTVIAAALVVITLGLSRLEPASPTVERSAVWLDTVKRGPMLRAVRGTGTLVPEVIWWIPAVTDGRVERILVLPGAAVQADTVLVELSNPELDLAATDAEWQVTSANADRTALEVTLENELLALQASVARLEADHQEAVLQREVDEELFADGLISERNVRLLRARVEQLAKLGEIEKARLQTWDKSREARLAAQQARIEQAKALHALRTAQVDALRVRAGTEGVLEQMPVEVGQRVPAGTILAKVTDVRSLKAVVRIPETQARDVQPGQVAAIDTRNGVVPGRVIRINPAVQEATVSVDVVLEGPMPKGARPDLTIVGTIEIERLDDVLFVGRPVHAQTDSTISLFKLRADGVTADRVSIELGSNSVDTVEIRRGLQVGDQVILSDMSRWDEFDRVRLR